MPDGITLTDWLQERIEREEKAHSMWLFRYKGWENGAWDSVIGYDIREFGFKLDIKLSPWRGHYRIGFRVLFIYGNLDYLSEDEDEEAGEEEGDDGGEGEATTL